MAHKTRSLLEIHNISFSYPGKDTLFSGVDFSLGAEKVALVGDNGCGKTTLLQIISGALTPSSGSILVRRDLFYLKQSHLIDRSQTISSYLGVHELLEAQNRIEVGAAQEGDFDLMEGNWGIIEQISEILSLVGLEHIALTRRLSELSGGEITLAGMAALLLKQPQVILMDEPTNNLDRRSRSILSRIIHDHEGLVFIATHDRTLLKRMDKIIELHDGKALTIEGNYDTYREHIKLVEQSSQRRHHDAIKELRRIEAQRQVIQLRQAKQKKSGQKAFENKRGSKKSMNTLKRKSQVFAGKEIDRHRVRLEEALLEKKAAHEQLRTDTQIKVTPLTASAIHKKQLLTLQDTFGTTITIGGKERVALLGNNGAGKSRLIESIFDSSLKDQLHAWAHKHTSEIAVITQNALNLTDNNTLLEEMFEGNPLSTHEEVRAQLARMLFRRDLVHTKVQTLSGGQRFHIALAKILAHRPPYEMIILDEPTNNLDLSTLQQISILLNEYEGALLVVSHDQDFLDDIHIERIIRLDHKGLSE